MNVVDQKQIIDYLKFDLDSLFEKLAKLNVPDGFDKTGKNDFVDLGKKYLESIDEFLYQTICNELQYCKNKSRYYYLDTNELIKLLYENLDFREIAEENGWIPKTLVIAILIKLGLERFCKC